MKKHIFIVVTFIAIAFAMCTSTLTPKPRAYFRISLPEKHYSRITEKLPYSFEMPQYCHLEEEQSRGAEKYWTNIVFDKMNAKIHLSFKRQKRNASNCIPSMTLVTSRR